MSHLQAAIIRWTGEKTVKEYEFEHSVQRETVRQKKRNFKSTEVTIANYSHGKSTKEASNEVEPSTAYSQYTDNGNE